MSIKATKAVKANPTLPPATGAELLRQNVRIAASAAIGVSIIRTREPFDCRTAIEEMCLTDDQPLRVWNIVRGWQTVDHKDAQLRITEADTNTIDPMPAIMKLYDAACPMPPNYQDTTGLPKRGIFVMMWPDPYIKNIPQMRAVLGELSNEMTYGRQRLFLIVPPSFEVPDELAELIPIIDFDLPTMPELRELYEFARKDAQNHPTQRTKTEGFTEEDIETICSAGAGMTRREFTSALCMAYAGMEIRGQSGLETFRKEILTRKTDVVKRSEVLEILPPVPMENIGGLDNLKEWMAKRAVCFTPQAKVDGIEAPKGVGLIGPPGTGKTAAAKAISSVLQVPLVKFDVSRVFGSLVGQSEARVSKAVQMIDAMAPCVCLVDEVDKVFSTGQNGDSGTSTRVLGKILTHMQESKADVFWVLTANRTDNLPPELLRKGRLSEIWSVTTPNEAERREILSIHLRTRGIDLDTVQGLDDAVDASREYVGGELEAAVQEAIVEAYHAKVKVSGQHIVDALKNMKPLSKSFEAQFNAMAAWAESHARPASNAASAATVRGRARSRVRGVPSAPASDDELAG